MKYHVPHASVVGQWNTGGNIFLLTLSCPEIAAEARPGQFAHLRCGNTLDPLLRRPLSIFQAEAQKGLLSFCYQVVGKGTQLLSKLQAGAQVDVMGPLGRGFDTEISGKRIGLVGGGMGIAPLVFLGRMLARHNQVQGFWGTRTKELLPPLADQFPSGDSGVEVACGFPYLVATEDGSAGRQGLVTGLLEEWLEQEPFDRLYACGPRPMLAAVHRLAQARGIPLQVSLEAVMACGVGACLGCTCEKGPGDGGAGAEGTGNPVHRVRHQDAPNSHAAAETSAGSLAAEKRLKVCQDGPVFWAEEVRWDGE